MTVFKVVVYLMHTELHLWLPWEWYDWSSHQQPHFPFTNNGRVVVGTVAHRATYFPFCEGSQGSETRRKSDVKIPPHYLLLEYDAISNEIIMLQERHSSRRDHRCAQYLYFAVFVLFGPEHILQLMDSRLFQLQVHSTTFWPGQQEPQTSQWYDSATDRTIAAASIERGLIIHLNGAGPLEHRKCNQQLKTHDEWQAKKRTY